jgi:DASH complex subunit DAD3
MTSPIPANDIFNSNPYESHPSLTTTEAEVLWEYAKLAQHIKLVSTLGIFL